ncbi:iron ABC transporter, partial [Pseudomonas sp. MWU13-2860]
MRLFPLTLALAASLLLLSLASLLHGSGIDASRLLSGQALPELEWQLLWQLRLPRLLASASAGALLASAGAAVQARFRNPLAEPGLIGINSGAALAAAAALSL